MHAEHRLNVSHEILILMNFPTFYECARAQVSYVSSFRLYIQALITIVSGSGFLFLLL